MFSGVVWDFHSVHLQALWAFPDVVDPGDVGTLFIYHLHHLEESERGRNTFEIFTELSVKSQAVYFLLTHLSHLLVVVVSEVQIICWIDFILTAVAAWKKWWKHLSVILWCSYVIQLLRSWGSSCEMNSCVSPRLDKTNVKFGWRLIPQRDEQTVWLMRSWNPSEPIKHQKIQTRFPSWRCDTYIGSEARFITLNQFLS